MIERATEKFAKKLLGESEVESVLQRLDRLTHDEARMTVAQTLQVVHGLMSNTRVVMDGAFGFRASYWNLTELLFLKTERHQWIASRRHSVCGPCSPESL